MRSSPIPRRNHHTERLDFALRALPTRIRGVSPKVGRGSWNGCGAHAAGIAAPFRSRSKRLQGCTRVSLCSLGVRWFCDARHSSVSQESASPGSV